MSVRWTRRGVLSLAAGSAATVLAACGGETVATPTTVAAARPTSPPLAGGTGGQTPVPAVATTAPTAAMAATGGQTPAAPAAASAPMATRAAGSAVAAAATTAPIGMAGMTPLSTPNAGVRGTVRYWQVTPDDVNLPSAKYHEQWIASLPTTLPNVMFKEELYSSNNLLDKLRVVLKAGQAPDMAALSVQWCPEFAATGVLQEINLADYGYSADKFWPGALKSVTWEGKLYGIPVRNETMSFIYNKEIFQRAGLDPNKGPETWEDVRTFSKQIKEKTGKAGFGMVAKLNAGNTPYRYLPLLWAYGGAIFDETAENPKYERSTFDSPANVQALDWMLDVYTSGAAPQASLTNTQIEVRDLFVSGEVAMMIDQPVGYTLTRAKAPSVAEQMNYVLMPKGPVRRAVAFGGASIVIFKGAKDFEATKAVTRDLTSPLQSLRFGYEGSNPGNRDAFALPEQQTRLKEIKFLDVATEMLQYGISFPAVPENADIVNLIVPQMIQDVLTKSKSSQQAAQDAAKKVNDLVAKRSRA